jgi:hypothetical protein
MEVALTIADGPVDCTDMYRLGVWQAVSALVHITDTFSKAACARSIRIPACRTK